MTDRRRSTAVSEAESRLARLGAHLSAHRFEVELTVDGLVLFALGLDCSERNVLATITCHPRMAGDGRLWFFSSDGEPIAKADHIIDAVVAITGRLAGVS